jgi:hypothetical protein
MPTIGFTIHSAVGTTIAIPGLGATSVATAEPEEWWALLVRRSSRHDAWRDNAQNSIRQTSDEVDHDILLLEWEAKCMIALGRQRQKGISGQYSPDSCRRSRACAGSAVRPASGETIYTRLIAQRPQYKADQRASRFQ